MPKTATKRAGADRLRAWLDSEDITQRAFAKTLGIAEPHLSMILSRKDFPSLTLASRIEEHTGITAREFAEGD